LHPIDEFYASVHFVLYPRPLRVSHISAGTITPKYVCRRCSRKRQHRIAVANMAKLHAQFRISIDNRNY